MRLLHLGLCLTFVGCNTMPAARQLLGTPTGSDSGTSSRIATGLPCDVDQLLVSRCQSCHGQKLAQGVPMALVTYADLSAPSKSDPSKTVAALSLERMNSPSAPMPPSGPLAAADLAVYQKWIDAGAPQGDCVSGPDPLNAAPTCTSNQNWGRGNQGSVAMNPGMACISCHTQLGEGPRLAIAGTVYATGHEPDRCDGDHTAVIVITGADGQTLTLTPNAAGNFTSRAAVARPYTAQVVASGMTRKMATPQMSGDCNSCHTQDGANGAPGRITLP